MLARSKNKHGQTHSFSNPHMKRIIRFKGGGYKSRVDKSTLLVEPSSSACESHRERRKVRLRTRHHVNDAQGPLPPPRSAPLPCSTFFGDREGLSLEDVCLPSQRSDPFGYSTRVLRPGPGLHFVQVMDSLVAAAMQKLPYFER